MDTLSVFNQQILQCQDDAYTLAWYLLGDEVEAEAVMQAAVEAAYPCFSSNRQNCRLGVFKQVVKHCRARRPAAKGLPASGTHLNNLHALPEAERLALVLIDICGLGYADTARVVDQSVKEVSCRLAQARQKMIVHEELQRS